MSGAYQVSARLGTKSPAAQASFTVRTPTQAGADLATHEQALISDITTYVAQVVQAVAQMPDSPARTLVTQKLQPVQAKLGPLQQSGGYLAHALALFANLQALHPETAAVLQPLYEKLDSWDEQEQQRRAALEKEIAQSRSQLAQCDSIDHAIEVLNAIGGALNFAAMPGEIITSFGKDLLVSKASGAAGNNAAAAFAIQETAKVVPAAVEVVADPLALITVLAGMVVDCAVAAQQNLFARYCDKFEGDFSATMDAHFMTGDTGLEWWSYKIAIAGTLSLRYPKDASGHAVALSGQFLGHATSFGYHEDFWHTGGLKMLAGGTVRTLDIAPEGGGRHRLGGPRLVQPLLAGGLRHPRDRQLRRRARTFTLGDCDTGLQPRLHPGRTPSSGHGKSADPRVSGVGTLHACRTSRRTSCCSTSSSTTRWRRTRSPSRSASTTLEERPATGNKADVRAGPETVQPGLHLIGTAPRVPCRAAQPDVAGGTRGGWSSRRRMRP